MVEARHCSQKALSFFFKKNFKGTLDELLLIMWTRFNLVNNSQGFLCILCLIFGITKFNTLIFLDKYARTKQLSRKKGALT